MTDFNRPSNWGKPGHIDRGDEFETVLDGIEEPYLAWTLGAPTWTASAGTPALGNGSLTGRYRRIGKTLQFQFRLVAGSTTTFGTAGAIFFFTVPGIGSSVPSETFMGAGWFFDSSAANNYTLTWKIDSGSTQLRMWRNDASPSAELANNAPVVMATSDQVMCSGLIEVT